MKGQPSPTDTPVVMWDRTSVEEFRRHGWWTGRTLPAELLQAGREHSDVVSLVTSEVEWTYAELFDRATAFGAGLRRAAEVQPGEPVMFQMGNVAETVASYLGCLLAGARPVCTLPQHGTREIGLLADHVGARVLLTQADFKNGQAARTARTLLGQGTLETAVTARGHIEGALSYDGVLAAGDGARPEDLGFTSVDPESIAVFQLSGGTTGLPKVAPRLHEEYTYNSRAWAQALGYGPGTTVLYPLPVMHNAGISLAVQPAILSGSKLVLAPSAEVRELIDLIRKYRPQVLPLVPPALAVRLLDANATPADLECIEAFVVGGQVLPTEVAERLRDELGIDVRQMFGMAEGMFLLTPEGADESIRFRTVGTPISAGDEIRILSPGTEDDLDVGEIGELACRGPYTICGYYRAEAHNRTAFTSDGFYRTGDLARRHSTPDGPCYSIEGRIKDVINRGVEKIHAEEVEELIVQHPAIRTAALIAMPDRVLGERACAYLELDAGAEAPTVQSLGSFLLQAGLAKYKLPERIEVIDELPLTNVGKVSKKALRDDIQLKLQRETEDGGAS